MSKQIRYNLKLPESVYYTITEIAERYATTRLEIIRKFIMLGLLIIDMQEKGRTLYVKDDEQLTEIQFII
ncbi:MAG: hypothetical protein GWN55_16025 [Phycisphaerae bacterium]|nr:hypothetical protein [Phycisphaerae bacterium]NIX00479.1 hypothetical protein [Phycisphaerae bacterium]